jgi:tartrate-resistant acid phosphatase type 5
MIRIRMNRLRWLMLPLLVAFLFAQTTPETQTLPLPESLIARLPEPWRDITKRLAPLTQANIDTAAKESDDDLRYRLAATLSTKAEGQAFLAGWLEKEPSAKVRTRIVTSMRSYWASNPATHEMLRRLGMSDRDPRVSMECIEMLRRIQADDLARLVRQRLDLARRGAPAADVHYLAEQQERWISLRNGVMLPDFLRKSPPVFTVKPADQNIRVLAFGDYGNGSVAQRQLSEVMLRTHRSKAFDFGITLGDNFYSVGMDSPDDPRWNTQWEQLYGPLGIIFYSSLGNHDWGQSDSPAAEILYSARSPNWRMPSPYYSYLAGPVQFFALDTNELSDRQLMWLKDGLARSQAKWKVVYGHHHIFSAWRLDNPTLIARLLPVLKGHADLYLCGHDHNLQVLRPEAGLHFVVAGGGGAGTYQIKPYERSVFKKPTYGFAVLEADPGRLGVRLIDITGEQVYEHAITK